MAQFVVMLAWQDSRINARLPIFKIIGRREEHCANYFVAPARQKPLIRIW